jgi:hypothetical protein
VIDLFAFYTHPARPGLAEVHDLFRFYIDIQFKMDHEVKRAAEALRSLYQAIEALYPALRVDEPRGSSPLRAPSTARERPGRCLCLESRMIGTSYIDA